MNEPMLTSNCVHRMESLNEKLDIKMSALNEKLELMNEHIEQSTSLARIQMESRLNSMNEFRDALRDQSARMLTRTESDVLFARITSDLRTLFTFKDTQEGKASQQSVTIAYAIALLSIVISVVLKLI